MPTAAAGIATGIGTLGAAGIGAATAGSGTVQPIPLQYHNQAQDILMPQALEDVAAWGSKIPAEYLENTALQNRKLGNSMAQWYAPGVANGTPQQKAYGVTQAFGNMAPNQAAANTFSQANSQQFGSQAPMMPNNWMGQGGFPQQGNVVNPDMASLQSQVQQSRFAPRPQFGQGGGNLGGYGAGYSGQLMG